MTYASRCLAVGASLVLLPACGSSASTAPAASPPLAIVTSAGAPAEAVAGDAIALKVAVVAADGSVQDLPASAKVDWALPDLPTPTVTALPPESTAASPIPAFGDEPTAAWIDNPSRTDRPDDLTNVLFFLDPGTVQNGVVTVTATVRGATPSGTVTAQVNVNPTPAGDWNRGATLYGAAGANCASCHGASGHGSPDAPEAATYTMAGGTYPYPAPGLNAEPGNTAGDPAWNAALFAVAARADIDNGGIALRKPMADWISTPNPATGAPLTTQDFADIYAFLKTQTH